MKTSEGKILNNAVIYCRVSTKEQVEEGNSLITQEKICKEYCSKHLFEVTRIFIEQGESAKTADRTELKKLLSFCSQKKNQVKAVIIYRLDRLSRNTDDYSQIRLLLKRYGVEIKSTAEYFENTAVGRFMENTMANIAQLDNDIRTERSVGGMKEAVREGRYVWQAALGYENSKVNGKSNIIKSNMAPLIRKAFEMVAQNHYTSEEIRRILHEDGLRTIKGKKVSKTYFYYLLKNKIYTGLIEKFGEKHQGKFEPIISEGLYNQVQRVLRRKGTISRDYTTDNPDFPLRRFVTNENGTKLTGSWCKGRNKHYPFYRFGKEKNSINRDEFEQNFKQFMDSYSFQDCHISLLTQLFIKHSSTSKENLKKRIQHLNNYISEQKSRQETLISKNIDGIIPDRLLKEQLDQIEQKISESNEELEILRNNESDTDFNIEIIKEYLTKPSKVWEKADINAKKYLQWFQFPKGVTFINNKFGTAELSNLFKLKNLFSEFQFHNVHHLNELSNQNGLKISDNLMNIQCEMQKLKKSLKF